MIVKMKKLSVLLYHKERQHFLKGLQNLGVAHIDADREVVSEEVETLSDEIKEYNTIIKEVEKLAKERKGLRDVSSFATIDDIRQTFTTLTERKDHVSQELTGLIKDIQLLEPWGDFNSKPITKLKENDLYVFFYEVSKKKFEQLETDTVTVFPVNETSHLVRFAAVSKSADNKLPFEPVLLPEESLSVLKKKKIQFKKELVDIDNSLAALLPEMGHLKQMLAQKSNDLDFLSIREGLELKADEKLFAVEGWVPAASVQRVSAFLNEYVLWYSIDDPGEEDNIPVALKNNAFVRLFEPITKQFSLPDYHEIDPTPFFAPFYMFFYGMCLGDVGYGLLIVLIAVFAIFKGPVKLKPLFILGVLLGGMTIINGAFLNTFFGQNIFDVKGISDGLFIKGRNYSFPFLGMVIENGKTAFPAMSFSIIIGMVQVLLGMILQCVNSIRQKGWAHGLPVISYMFLTVGFVLWVTSTNFLDLETLSIWGKDIGITLSNLHKSTYITTVRPAGLVIELNVFEIIGAAMLLLFNGPGKKVLFKPLGFLGGMYNYLSGIMADGLSYLRLFALGLAGGLLGNSYIIIRTRT
jgi:V/A-type H+-transporting ATPase subunit I